MPFSKNIVCIYFMRQTAKSNVTCAVLCCAALYCKLEWMVFKIDDKYFLTHLLNAEFSIDTLLAMWICCFIRSLFGCLVLLVFMLLDSIFDSKALSLSRTHTQSLVKLFYSNRNCRSKIDRWPGKWLPQWRSFHFIYFASLFLVFICSFYRIGVLAFTKASCEVELFCPSYFKSIFVE